MIELNIFFVCEGDIEAMLEMDTYMQTAICYQPTDVLVLELSHYQRLFAKRASNAPILPS